MPRAVVRPPWRRLARYLTWRRLEPLADLCGFRPHAGQIEILEDPARFRIVCCGRRFGKSLLAGFLAMAVASMGGLVWIVAPTYDLASIPFDNAVRYLSAPGMRGMMLGVPSEAQGSKRVRTRTGGMIVTKTSENPKSLLGRSPDLIIFEEAAQEEDGDIWATNLRPALMDSEGALFAISTPRGHNWFKDLFDRGESEDPEWSEYRSFRKPSHSNPLLKPAEIDAIVAELTETIIQQEIDADFLAPAGAVFRKVAQACRGEWLDSPLPGRDYVIGCDIAQFNDWTVAAVMDAGTGAVVHAQRFNRIDWDHQITLIAGLAEVWNAPVLIDATNNNKVADDLDKQVWWADVVPFVFTQLSKQQVVNQYALALDRGEVELPQAATHAVAAVIRQEMESYRYERTASGTLKMGAPSGKHDDCVIAVVLAYELAKRSIGGTPVVGPRIAAAPVSIRAGR